jgi:hypothetical protein
MAFRRLLTKDVSTYNAARAFNGYTLFAPMSTNDAFLIDMAGNIVHHWTTPFPPAQHGRLLPNGNLLWAQKGGEPPIPVGGTGSEIVELDWDGKVVWSHKEPTINHDFQRLENGNTLFNTYIEVPESVASRVRGGVPRSEAKGKIFGSALKEVDREGRTAWEWKMYEHMDPAVDAQCPLCPRSIWGYINSVHVRKDGNLVITFRFENQVAIVERRSGTVFYRSDPKHTLGHPHCATPLDNGNILLFDNGTHRMSTERGAHELAYSRVVELDPKSDKIVWMYKDPNVFNFYSSICGGAQRLPNGNTLICESTKGRFFEVTADHEIVWEYRNPFLVDRSDYWGWTLSSCVFQAHRYAPDYPGLLGKDLSPHAYDWQLQARKVMTPAQKAALARLEKLGY